VRPEFVTLTKTDPDFDSYLLGTFSSTHRALPVETYHAATARERVTFRVLPLEQVGAPVWWIVYFWCSRPELAGLTLGPAMAAWLLHVNSLHEWTKWPSWFAMIGLFFLHTSVFLLNDVQDHMRGFDRLNHRRGSQVIQKGWVTGQAMYRWAWVNLVLAILFGVPAFFNAPFELALVCLAAALCLVLVITKSGVRIGACDLALVLLFGPLLVIGIALASFGESYPQDIILGLAFGVLTLWVFQVRQFEDLFRARSENFRTFLGHLSFDQARKIVIGEGLLLLAIQPAAGYVLGVPILFLVISPLVSVPLIFTLQRFLKAASPLSSSLVGSSKWALASHLSWTLWWVLALGVAWL
jgi:1,4-dihydroxy-2-naphthoate octaprenyltransferase